MRGERSWFRFSEIVPSSPHKYLKLQSLVHYKQNWHGNSFYMTLWLKIVHSAICRAIVLPWYCSQFRHSTNSRILVKTDVSRSTTPAVVIPWRYVQGVTGPEAVDAFIVEIWEQSAPGLFFRSCCSVFSWRSRLTLRSISYLRSLTLRSFHIVLKQTKWSCWAIDLMILCSYQHADATLAANLEILEHLRRCKLHSPTKLRSLHLVYSHRRFFQWCHIV